MEKDFHYYLTYSLAKMTEQDHPDVIAYACQFVDDNNEGSFSIDGESNRFPEKIETGGGNYYPIMTQSLSPKSFDLYVQKYVYVPFHFLPGNNDVVIDGKKNPLSTTPNSKNAQSLLHGALKSNDALTPYRIGIALHTFADTWSHQNFTGIHENWNSVYPWYNVFKSLAPNIGHAEAGHAPDVISDAWTDHRLGQQINNRARALEATGEMYKILRQNSKKGPTWGDAKKDYRQIINTSGYNERIQAISDFLADNHKGPVPGYSKDEWIDAAVDRKGEDLVMKSNYTDTDWHRFHQAAKTQFAYALDLIKEI